MRKSLTQKSLAERIRVGALAVTMSISLAAFGCSTNSTMTSSQAELDRPAGGSMTPSLTHRPGSAAAPTMISGAVDPAVDAVAVLEANRGYQGRVLGPAAPGTGAPSISMQYETGQFISPAAQVNPQFTINNSISSDPVPAIPSGDFAAGSGGGVADVALGAGSVDAALVDGVAVGTGEAGLANVGNAGTTAGTNANFGVTGLSNTTATGLTNATTGLTNVGTGSFATRGRLNVDLTAASRAAGTSAAALSTVRSARTAATGINTTTGVNATTGGSAIRLSNTDGRVLITNQNASTNVTTGDATTAGKSRAVSKGISLGNSSNVKVAGPGKGLTGSSISIGNTGSTGNIKVAGPGKGLVGSSVNTGTTGNAAATGNVTLTGKTP